MRLWYLVKAHCDPFENYDISGVLAQILIIVATTPAQIEDSFVLVEKVFSEINEVHVGNSSSVKRIIEKLWFEITNHLEVNKNTSYYRVVIVLRIIRRHQIFLGGPRTKMKKSSQKRGSQIFRCSGLFSLWRH